MQPAYFSTPAKLRAWLEKHHDTASELLVGFWKRHTGKPSITWRQLVEECLCFGWIDGVGHSLGDESHTIRITPRRAKSNWSLINVKLVEKLRSEGRMTPSGEAAFAARDAARTGLYSFEQAGAALDPQSEKRFRANARAWAWWMEQPPSYRKAATWFVISAKREATREKRLALVMKHAARGERIPPLVSPTAKGAKSKRRPGG